MESLKIKSNARKSTYSGKPNAANQEQLRMRQAFRPEPNANHIPVKSSSTTWKRSGWSLSARARPDSKEELLTPMRISKDNEGRLDVASSNRDVSDGSANDENVATREKKSPDQRSLWSLFSTPKPEDTVDENASKLGTISNGSSRVHDEKLIENHVNKSPPQDPRIRKREEPETKKSPPSFNLFSKMKPLRNASRNLFAHLGKKPDVPINQEASAISVTPTQSGDVEIAKKTDNHDQNYTQSSANLTDNNMQSLFGRLSTVSSDAEPCSVSNQKQTRDSPVAEDVTSEISGSTKEEERPSTDRTMPTLTLPADIGQEDVKGNISSEEDESECLFIDEQASADCPSDIDEDSGKTQEEEEGSHVLRVWSLQSEEETNSHIQNVDHSSSYSGDASSFLDDSLPLTGDESLNSLERFITENTVGLGDIGDENCDSVSKSSDEKTLETPKPAQSNAGSNEQMIRNFEEGPPKLQAQPNTHHLLQELDSLLECSTLQSEPHPNVQPELDEEMSEESSLDNSRESDNSNIAEPARNIFSLFGGGKKSSSPSNNVELVERQSMEQSANSSYRSAFSKDAIVLSGSCSGERDSLAKREHPSDSSAGNTMLNKEPQESGLQTVCGNLPHVAPVTALSRDESVDTSLLTSPITESKDTSIPSLTPEIGTGEEQGNEHNSQSNQPPELSLEVNPSSSSLCEKEVSRPSSVVPVPEEDYVEDISFLAFENRNDLCSYSKTMKLKMQRKTAQTSKAPAKKCVYPVVKNVKMKKKKKNPIEARIKALEQDLLLSMESQGLTEIVHPVLSRKGVALDTVKKNDLFVNVRNEELERISVSHKSKKSKHKKKHRSRTEVRPPFHLTWPGRYSSPLKMSRSKHRNSSTLLVKNSIGDRDHGRDHVRKPEPGHYANAKMNPTISSDPVKVVGLEHGKFSGSQKNISKIKGMERSVGKTEIKRNKPKHSSKSQEWEIFSSEAPALSERPSLKLKFKAKTSPTKVEQSPLALSTKPRQSTVPLKSSSSHIPVNVQQLHVPSLSATAKSVAPVAKKLVEEKVQPSKLPSTSTQTFFLVASKSSTSTNRFVTIAPKPEEENVQPTGLPSTTTKRHAPVAPKLVEEKAQPARLPEEESRPFKPFEKPVASKKSAFVSDALEDLLQGAGMNKQMKPLISPSTMSVSNAKVVYKVPSQQSHSVKTLDMALRRQKPVNVSAHTSNKVVLGFKDSHYERNEMKKKKKKKKNKHKDRSKEEKVEQGYVFGTGPGDLVRKLPNLPFSCYGKTVARPLFARQQQVSNTVGEKSEGFLEVRNVLSLSGKTSTKRHSDELEVQAVKKIKQEPEEIDETVSHIDDNLPPILNINLPGSGKYEILSKEEKNSECVESQRKESQSSSGTNEVKKCGEYCRLGCICSSINDSRTVQERSSHCRKVDCMFDCVCKRISTQTTSSTRIRRPPTFAQDMLFYDDSYKIWKYGDKESSTSEIKRLQLIDHLPATEKRNLVNTCARTRLFVTDKPEKLIKRKRKEQEDKSEKHNENKKPSDTKVGHHLASEGSGVNLSNQNQVQQNESRVDNKQHKSSGKQGFIPLSVPSGIKHQNANQSGTEKTVPAQFTATLSRGVKASQGNAVTTPVISTFLPVAKQYLLNGNIMNMVLLPNGNRILVPATAVPKVINTIGTSVAGKKAQQPKAKCDNSTSSVTTGLLKPALPVRYQITSSGIAISPAPVVPAEKSNISQGTISVAMQSDPGKVQTPNASTKPKVNAAVSLSGSVAPVSSTKAGSDIQYTEPPKLKSQGVSPQPSGIIQTPSASTTPKVPVTVSLTGDAATFSSTRTGSDIQHTVAPNMKSPGVSDQPSGIVQTSSASTNSKVHVTVSLTGDVATVSSTRTGSNIQHTVAPKLKSPGVSDQPSGIVQTSSTSTNSKVPVTVSLTGDVATVSSTRTGSNIQHTVAPKLKSPGVSAQPSGIVQTSSASTNSKVHVTVSLTGDAATVSSTRTGTNIQHTVVPKLKSPGVLTQPSGIIQSPSASTNTKVHATVSISGGVATISSPRTGSDIRHTVPPKLKSPGVSAQPSVLVKPPYGVKAPTVTIYKNNSVDCKSPPVEAMKSDSDMQKKHPAKKHESLAKSATHNDEEESHSPHINDILGDYEASDMRITKTFFANFGDQRVYFMISTDTDFQWTHLAECVVNQSIKFFSQLDKPEGSIYTFRDIHINLLSKSEDVIRLSLTLQGPSKKPMEKVSQRSESTYSNKEDIAEDEQVMGHGKGPTCSNKENLKGDDQILETKAHISNQEHSAPVDAQNSSGGGTLRPLASTLGPRDSISTPLTTGDKKQMNDESNITKVAATSHASDDHEQTVTPIKTQMTFGKSWSTSNKTKSTPNTPRKALSSSDGKLSSSLPEFAKLSEIVKRKSLDEDTELSPMKKVTRNASEWLQDPTIKKSLDTQRYSGVRTPWFRTEKEGVKVVLQRGHKKRPFVGKGGKSPAKTIQKEMLNRHSASSLVDISAKESSKHVERVVLENQKDDESTIHEGDVLDHEEIPVQIVKMQLCEDGLNDGDKLSDSKDISAKESSKHVERVVLENQKDDESTIHEGDVLDHEEIPVQIVKMQLIEDGSNDGEISSDSKTHKGDVQDDDGAIPAHRIKMQLCEDSSRDGEKDSESTQIDDNFEDPVGSSKNPAPSEERRIDGQGEQQNTGIAVVASSPKTTSPRKDVSVKVGMEEEKEIGIEDAEGTLGIEHFARFSEEDDYGLLDFDEEMPASFDLTAGYEDDSSSIASLKIDEDIENDVTDAHIVKSNPLPEEFVKESPESPEVKGDTQQNFQLLTDIDIDATDEKMSRASIISRLEDQVHLFSDVIKESPSPKDIQTETTPVKNPDVYPKKSPMLNIKFVATSNENCTSRVCTSPLSEVLSENTQGTSPSPSKSYNSSEDGLSDTDINSTKADGPPEAGVSNTEILPPKSTETFEPILSNTETVPPKSTETSEPRLSNTEILPPKSTETSEPRLSNTETVPPKSTETSEPRLSNTEILPPKSTETSEDRLSNAETVPPQSIETSEDRMSNSETVPPQSIETSEARLSNTELVPPKSTETFEPRLSNTEIAPPKSIETSEVRLSNTENVPPKSIETSETRLFNTEIAPPNSIDPSQAGMSCTKTLKSDNQSEASLPNTAIVTSKSNEPSEASLLDSEMSSAKGNELSGASLSNKEIAQTKSNDISKNNLSNKEINDDVILLNTEMGPTKDNDLPEADLSDIEIDVVNTDDDDVEIDVETVSGSTQNVQNIDPYSSLRDITSRLSSALQKEQAADVPKKSKHRSSTSSSITLGLRMGSPRKLNPQLVGPLSWRKDSQSSSSFGLSKGYGKKISPETSKQKDSRSLSTPHHHVKSKKKKSKRKSPVCPTKQWESPIYEVVYKDSSTGEESSEGKASRLINHNILERKRREELRKAFVELNNEIQERTDLKAPAKRTILKQATDLVSKLKDTWNKLLKKEEQLRTEQRRLVYVHSNLLHHARCNGQIVFPEGSKLAESMDRIRTGLSHVVTSASQGGKDVKEYVSEYVQGKGAKRKAESVEHNLGKAHSTVQKKESDKATIGSYHKAMKQKRKVSSSRSHSKKMKFKERKKRIDGSIRHLPVTRKDMQRSLGSSDSAGVDTALKGNQGTSERAMLLPSGSQVLSQSRFGPYHVIEDESDEESLPIDCYVSSSDEQEEDEVDFGLDDDEQYSDDGFIPESEDEHNAKVDEKRGTLSDEESKADNSDREIVNFNMDLDDFEHGTADSRSDLETGSEVESRKRPMPKFRKISQRNEMSSPERHDSDDDVLVISEKPLGTGDTQDKQQKERGKLGSQDWNTFGESSKFQSQSKAMNIPKQDTVTNKVQSIPSVLKTTPNSEMNKAPLVNVIDEIMNRLKGDAPPSPVSSVEEKKTNKVMGPSSVGLNSNDENEGKVKSTSTKQSSTARISTAPLGASNFSPGNDLNSQKRTSVLAVGGVALNSFKRTEDKLSASSVKPKGDVKPCDVMLDSSESSSADDESTTVATSKSTQQEERNVSAISRKPKDDVQPSRVVLDYSDSSSDDETTAAVLTNSTQQEERNANANAISRKPNDDVQPSRIVLDDSDSSSDDKMPSTSYSKDTGSVSNNTPLIAEKNPVASLQKTRVLPMKGALADLISSVKTRVENDDASDSSDDSDIEDEVVSEDEDSDDESNDEEGSDDEEKEEEETKENIVAKDESTSNDGENERQDIPLINKDAAGPSSISGETDQQEDMPVSQLAGSSSSAGRKEEERENLANNFDDEAVTGPTGITKFQQGNSFGEDSTDDDDAACLSYAAMGNDEDNEALFDADDCSSPFSPISLDMNIASDDDIIDSFDDSGDAVKSSSHLPSKASATVASTSTDETKPRETSSQAEQSSEAHQTLSASSKPDLTLDEAISFLNVEKNSDGTLNVFLKGDYNDEKLGELFEKPEVMDYIMTAAAKKD